MSTLEQAGKWILPQLPGTDLVSDTLISVF